MMSNNFRKETCINNNVLYASYLSKEGFNCDENKFNNQKKASFEFK